MMSVETKKRQAEGGSVTKIRKSRENEEEALPWQPIKKRRGRVTEEPNSGASF
jgi:hypothetical protein